MVVKLNVSCCLDINNQNKKNPGNSEMKRYLSIKQNKIIIKYILLIILLDFFHNCILLTLLEHQQHFPTVDFTHLQPAAMLKIFHGRPPKKPPFLFHCLWEAASQFVSHFPSSSTQEWRSKDMFMQNPWREELFRPPSPPQHTHTCTHLFHTQIPRVLSVEVTLKWESSGTFTHSHLRSSSW